MLQRSLGIASVFPPLFFNRQTLDFCIMDGEGLAMPVSAGLAIVPVGIRALDPTTDVYATTGENMAGTDESVYWT